MKRRIFFIVALILFGIFLVLGVRLVLFPSVWVAWKEDHDNNYTINFYGKVVDASGAPIQGAKVSIKMTTFRQAILLDGDEYCETMLERTTDQNGLFTIDGEWGWTLAIKSIEYPGLQWLHESGFTGNESYDFDHSMGYGYDSDPTSPAIFPLIKPGEIPVIMPSSGGVERHRWVVDGAEHNADVVNKPQRPQSPTVRIGPEEVVIKPKPIPQMYFVPGYVNALSPEKDEKMRSGNIQILAPSIDAQRRGGRRIGPMSSMLRDPETPDHWITADERDRKVTTRPALADHLPSGETPPPEELLVPDWRK